MRWFARLFGVFSINGKRDSHLSESADGADHKGLATLLQAEASAFLGVD